MSFQYLLSVSCPLYAFFSPLGRDTQVQLVHRTLQPLLYYCHMVSYLGIC